MLRIQGHGDSFWDSPNHNARIYPGGSEANVAATLAKLGHRVDYLSAFPNNTLADQTCQLLERIGVDCSKSIRLGQRIGTYYLLAANGLSSGEVVYDRQNSSFTQLSLEHLDMDSIFEGVDWFHWSAITPALSGSLAELLAVLLEEAQSRDIPISVDLNYRNRLWQYGKKPSEIVPQLVAYAQVIMGNVWAAEKMLGYQFSQHLNRQSSTEDLFSEATSCASMIFQRFPTAKQVAMTYRFMDNPRHNLFFGTHHTAEGSNVLSQIFESHQIIDRIGSGDAFMAGLIHAIRCDMTAQEIVETATREGFNKLFIAGDFDLQNK